MLLPFSHSTYIQVSHFIDVDLSVLPHEVMTDTFQLFTMNLNTLGVEDLKVTVALALFLGLPTVHFLIILYKTKRRQGSIHLSCQRYQCLPKWTVWFPDPSCVGGVREERRKGLEIKLGGKGFFTVGVSLRLFL